MKKALLTLIIVFSAVFAVSAENNKDFFLLKSGEIIEGEIVKFGANSFKVETSEGLIRINNMDVNLVAVNQDMTPGEKMRLGILDGKRYAKNKGGNLAVGLFFGLIGTAVVYIASDQMPSWEASTGPNKAIVNDSDYMAGYSKGAKSKSGGQALIGSLVWIGLLLAAGGA